jgi:Mg2+/Co2+ transporter CorC
MYKLSLKEILNKRQSQIVPEEKQNQVMPEENRAEQTHVSLIFDEAKIVLGFYTTREVRTNSLTKWKVLRDADNPWPFLKKINLS